MARKLAAPIPRVALTPPEAAAAIGCGEDFFTAHVRPELRLVRRGRKVLVPISEIERWVAENANRSIAEEIEAALPRPHPATSPHRGERL